MPLTDIKLEQGSGIKPSPDRQAHPWFVLSRRIQPLFVLMRGRNPILYHQLRFRSGPALKSWNGIFHLSNPDQCIAPFFVGICQAMIR